MRTDGTELQGVRRVVEILNDPAVPDQQKAALLAAIERTTTMWATRGGPDAEG